MNTPASLTSKRIGCIGCGNLGGAILGGLTEVPGLELYGYNRSPQRLEPLCAKGVTAVPDIPGIAARCDILIIGVKPYLVGGVRHEAERAGIPMPEVGIYEGEPNAFATGASASSAMVAVSTGLLNIMNRDEVEAELAHEISHVKNGDMVTQTLLQGVMNTFVVFFSRIIGWVVDRQILRNEDDAPGVGYYVTSLVLDICLGFLAGMVVAYFSRWREYHADAGASEIMQSNQPMINALRRLGGMEAQNELPGAVKGFGISGGIGSLFATHPSIEDRIAALESRRY